MKTATIEANGQLGYELMEDARLITVGEFKKLMNMQNQQPAQQDEKTIFSEVSYKTNQEKSPEWLQ